MEQYYDSMLGVMKWLGKSIPVGIFGGEETARLNFVTKIKSVTTVAMYAR